MPFGRKAGNIRAYEYGCRAPLAGEGEAVEQMRGRNRLWNQLVELDRRYAPQHEAIVTERVTATEEIERKAQRKAAFRDEAVRAALQALDKAEYEEARRLWLAAAEAGLYWVNHEEVKLAWQQARRRPGELRFHAFAGERGKVSVRWQHGLPVDKVLAGTDTLLCMVPCDRPSLGPLAPSTKRHAQYYQVSIRVGSEGRKPVWLTMPVILHRPLPPGGVLRAASVLRERVATHFRWKLVLLVNEGDSKAASENESTISMDIGWRLRPDGLRVCAWADSRGGQGELLLPSRWLKAMAKVDDIRSIRDQHFNVARNALVAWRLKAEQLPDWFTERTKHIALWRSPMRLAVLARRWRQQRFAGDEVIYAEMEAWQSKDRHLYEYEANLRDQLLAERRDRYRNFAANIARCYGRVALEEFDLRQVAQREINGKPNDLPEAACHQRVLAATSLLRLAIKNAAKREGVSVEEVDARNTTHLCPQCGSLEGFDAAAELMHTCGACGAVWDQDYAAAVNILRRASGG